MILELTEQQRQAVVRGDPVRINAAGIGDVIVFRPGEIAAQDGESDELAQMAALARRAAKRWGEENPFQS